MKPDGLQVIGRQAIIHTEGGVPTMRQTFDAVRWFTEEALFIGAGMLIISGLLITLPANVKADGPSASQFEPCAWDATGLQGTDDSCSVVDGPARWSSIRAGDETSLGGSDVTVGTTWIVDAGLDSMAGAPPSAGGVSVWTDRGCGPGAAIAAGDQLVAYIQSSQTGYAELTYHRPDGSTTLWADLLTAGRTLAIPLSVRADSPGGKRLLRLQMSADRAQDFCGISIQAGSTVLCGWTDWVSGGCAGQFNNEMLVSCGDAREYFLATALPQAGFLSSPHPSAGRDDLRARSDSIRSSPPISIVLPTAFPPMPPPGPTPRPSRLYAFWTPQAYWSDSCQRNIITGYSRATYLGTVAQGASCSVCPTASQSTGIINIWTNKGEYYGCDGTYRPGEPIALYVRVAQSGTAYLYNYWSDGQVKQLSLGYVQAGITYRLSSTVQAPDGRQVLRAIMPDFNALDYCSYVVAGTAKSYQGRLGPFVRVFDGCSYYPLLSCRGDEIVQLSEQSLGELQPYVGRYVEIDTIIDECGGDIAGQPLYGPIVTTIRTIDDPCVVVNPCQLNHGLQVEAIPDPPYEGQPFTLRVSGVSPDHCVPDSARSGVFGNVIVLDISEPSCDGPCFQVVTNWHVDVPIQPLSKGEYILRLQIACSGRTGQCTEARLNVDAVPTPEPPRSDADLGFRPDPNGYRFANRKLRRTWEMFEQYYGSEHVLRPGSRCTVAERYYRDTYEWVAKGWSCFGFSMTSLLSYFGMDQPRAGPFAMPAINRLYDRPQPADFTNQIAYYSGVQLSQQYADEYFAWLRKCDADPQQLVSELKGAISRRDPVVLGLRYSGNDYHAVVPYRMEDVSSTVSELYVYDNEAPAQERVVRFDQSGSGWSWRYTFVGSLVGYRERSGSCREMYVVPVRMALVKGTPLVTLCHSPERRALSDADQATSTAERLLVQLPPDGDWVIRDESGRRTGWLGDQLIAEIPDAYALPQAFGGETSLERPVYLRRQGYHIELTQPTTTVADYTLFADERAIAVSAKLKDQAAGSGLRVTASMDSAELTGLADHESALLQFDRELPGVSRSGIIDAAGWTGSADLRAEFDGAQLIVSRAGGSALYSARLEQAGMQPSEFRSPELTLGIDETHRLVPRDWSKLQAEGVTLEIDRGRDGTVDETRQLIDADRLRANSIHLPLTLNWHVSDRMSPVPLVDVQPYQPPGWDAPLVASFEPGTHTIGQLFTNAPTYVDIALRNAGSAAIPGNFYADLYIDETLVGRWLTAGGLSGGQSATVIDWSTTVAPGWHTLRLVVDSLNDVDEWDETNNAWEGEFYWQSNSPLSLERSPHRFPPP
jgi:hypothetical protein